MAFFAFLRRTNLYVQIVFCMFFGVYMCVCFVSDSCLWKVFLLLIWNKSTVVCMVNPCVQRKNENPGEYTVRAMCCRQIEFIFENHPQRTSVLTAFCCFVFIHFTFLQILCTFSWSVVKFHIFLLSKFVNPIYVLPVYSRLVLKNSMYGVNLVYNN